MLLPRAAESPASQFRLLDAAKEMAALGLTLRADPAAGEIELDDEAPEWVVDALAAHWRNLVYWWRHSPCVIAVCDQCGEWKLSGKKAADGSRCYVGGQYKHRKMLVRWGCQGTYRVVELPWSAARPRRKRKKVAA